MYGSDSACSLRAAISAFCRLLSKSCFWADVRTFFLGFGFALAFFFLGLGLGLALSFRPVDVPLVFFTGVFFGASLAVASVANERVRSGRRPWAITAI